MPKHCLREAGVGGSIPLTPTNNFNDLKTFYRAASAALFVLGNVRGNIKPKSDQMTVTA